ncbi:hypothetical protein AX16_004362 [Volvariella volvacea WC 439]|nr:hypothetical protein AX16_004362 [Volvariella volvacea WC 439]
MDAITEVERKPPPRNLKMDELPFHSTTELEFKPVMSALFVQEGVGVGLLSELPFFQIARLEYGRRNFKPQWDPGCPFAYRDLIPQDKNFVKTTLRYASERKPSKAWTTSLDKLPHLPLDVILEITSYLHPLDLWHLFTTSRGLRDALSSPASNGVWKRAWQRADIPSCPPDLAHHKWANLVLGEPICDGAMADYNETAYFRRKICLILALPCLCLKHDEALGFKLLCESPRGWRRADVKLLGSELEQLLRRPVHSPAHEHAGLSLQMKASFEAFTQKKAEWRRQVLTHALVCSSWAESRCDEARRIIKKDHDRVIKDLFKTGDGGSPVHDVIYAELRDNRIPKFSRKVLMKYLPQMKEKVERSGRSKSLELLSAFLLNDCYKEFLHKLGTRPKFRWSHPSSIEVMTWEPLASLLDDLQNLPKEVDVVDSGTTRLKLMQAFESNEVREKFTSWVGEKKAFFMAKLGSGTGNYRSLEERIDHSATSVFTCVGCKRFSHKGFRTYGLCLIGWDELKFHLNCENAYRHGRRGIVWSYKCSRVVESILEALNLPPETTIDQLDEVDARFLCGSCSGLRYDKDSYSIGRVSSDKMQALTWREFVGHAEEVDDGDERHQILKWHLLTPQAEAPVWACNHCPLHLAYTRSQNDVQSHLQWE